jgi:hypothetical protein
MNLYAIKGVVIHHSGGPRSQTFNSIRDYHMRERGYEDIAYHVVIMGEGGAHIGEIRYGRQLPRMGAHAQGRNKDTIGVCLVGDNTDPTQRWLQAQISALGRYLDALDLVVPGLPLLLHNEASDPGHTECPCYDKAKLLKLLRRTA